jgi:hypothetical protein
MTQNSPRSHAERRRFFDGFNLIEPGLVKVPALAAGRASTR